jgi:phage-related holin
MENIGNTSRRENKVVRHYLQQLASGFEWKIPLSILGTVIAFVEGFYGAVMWGFLGLYLLDLASGILKSKMNHVPITSKRLRESVTKLAAYMVAITALIIASKFEESFVAVVAIFYYYCMFTEIKSIFENVEEMGVKIPFFIKKKVKDQLDDIEDKEN